MSCEYLRKVSHEEICRNIPGLGAGAGASTTGAGLGAGAGASGLGSGFGAGAGASVLGASFLAVIYDTCGEK